MTILSFLLVIGPLIFVHELGHYFAGRWFGVKATSAARAGRSAGCRSAAM
jgi:membrane-associated protease RseP (regulator of RpoE activity)